jgi:hypothetical protein
MFLGFSERNIFGRALFPTLPIGETRVFNLLLIDEFAPRYGIPFSAWSCARRLWSNYTGNLIEVRRLSDGALLDIGFDANNELDIATLTGFIGAGSGFVRTLYDQTGSGNNFVQTTLANQPRIVNAGVLEMVNGKASMFFDGVNDSLIVPSSTATYKWMHDTTDATFDQHMYIVAQAGNSSDPNAVYSYIGNSAFASGNIGFVVLYDDRASLSLNNQYRLQVVRGTIGSFVINNQVQNAILPNQLNVVASQSFRNAQTALNRDYGRVNRGVELSNNTLFATTNNGNATFNLQLGANGNNGNSLLGYISEIVMYRQGYQDFVNNLPLTTSVSNYYQT